MKAQTRKLALFPECAAVLNDIAAKKECCDFRVASVAGRDFCYNEVTHTSQTFNACNFDTVIAMFGCCEDKFKDNQYLEYDCKTNLVGNDVACTGDACYEKYTAAV